MQKTIVLLIVLMTLVACGGSTPEPVTKSLIPTPTPKPASTTSPTSATKSLIPTPTRKTVSTTSPTSATNISTQPSAAELERINRENFYDKIAKEGPRDVFPKALKENIDKYVAEKNYCELRKIKDILQVEQTLLESEWSLRHQRVDKMVENGEISFLESTSLLYMDFTPGAANYEEVINYTIKQAKYYELFDYFSMDLLVLSIENPNCSQQNLSNTTSSPSLRYDPFGPDRDCGDFLTQKEAQAFFKAAGGPFSDPHRLDGDDDGIACELLP